MSATGTFDPSAAENLEDIEKQFAVKAVIQAQTYWGLLEKVPGTKLRLTKMDDDIFDSFIEAFPEYKDHEIVKKVNEDHMKSADGKKRWREWMLKYEKSIDDYNFGTLLRTDSHGEYNEENTIFVPRMQFYAIEITRNKYGLNDWIYQQANKN